MTIGLVAFVNIVDGKAAEFETAFSRQCDVVRENEPGNQLYRLFRSRETPGEYVVMEIYDDQAALDAHVNSAHHKASRPIMAPLRSGPSRVTILDAV